MILTDNLWAINPSSFFLSKTKPSSLPIPTYIKNHNKIGNRAHMPSKEKKLGGLPLSSTFGIVKKLTLITPIFQDNISLIPLFKSRKKIEHFQDELGVYLHQKPSFLAKIESKNDYSFFSFYYISKKLIKIICQIKSRFSNGISGLINLKRFWTKNRWHQFDTLPYN